MFADLVDVFELLWPSPRKCSFGKVYQNQDDRFNVISPRCLLARESFKATEYCSAMLRSLGLPVLDVITSLRFDILPAIEQIVEKQQMVFLPLPHL